MERGHTRGESHVVLPPRQEVVREYELVYIVTPRKAAAEVDTVISWISDQVTAAGGEVQSVHNWGRRRLAYPINRDFEGTYVYSTLRMPSAATAALESAMHITEDVIRHLLIRGIMPYDGSPPPEFVGERPRTAPRSAAVPAPEGAAAAVAEAEAPAAAPAEPVAEPAPTAEAEEPAADPAPIAEAEAAVSAEAAEAPAAPEAEAPAEDPAAPEATSDEASAEAEEARE